MEMRKFLFLSMLSMFLFSCDKQEAYLGEEEQQETYEISFGMGNFDASVITRAANTKTVYGINVYYDKQKDGVQDDIYAYGLFDDMNYMTITLIGGYKYRFVCSLVRDADDHLYYGPYSSNNFSGYAQPFQLSNSSSTAVQNRFIIGSSIPYLSGLSEGRAVIQDTGSSGYTTSGYYPSLERYYGEFADYVPRSNDRVIIPLKRTFFGNKLIVNGIVDGKVSVSCKVGYDEVWSENGMTEDYQSAGSIYSYKNVYQCWKEENNLAATVSYSYESNRGEWWNLSGSKNVTFKRNVMTTITINLSPDLSGGSVRIVEEPLGDDNVITLNGENGSLEVVTVVPGEE